ncbi:nucleic acid-binding, OB-fold protein [Artemisia annua]|uniref:Nucleic acid-binding, OB-fold protein n=1 Tax=Artemisia annua TaxID=35608 RepID=A0A2U1LUY2_ARTAN|nr:nucleic acid-binding, OB-fold protein [Artemisia annua]
MADAQAQSSAPQSQQQQQTVQQESDARARAKGKQVIVEQEDVDVMDLKPGDLGKPLDLKVYKKWISKNILDPSPTGICFMLLDKKGGAIQATGQLPDMRKLDTRLQLDGCYRIQGYRCKRTDNWQRTLDNKVTLLFGRYTQAAPIQDEGFPKHYFNFAVYNEVCHRADMMTWDCDHATACCAAARSSRIALTPSAIACRIAAGVIVTVAAGAGAAVALLGRAMLLLK